VSEKYLHLLEDWTQEQEREDALLTVVNKVRDIPFKFIGTRDVDSMLEAGVGTCNAKHMLLKELAEALRYKVRFLVDKFHLSDFLRGLDKENEKVMRLKEITSKLEPYYHTYIQIFKDEKWISLDITFDSFLEQFGFVVASDWDGKTDTLLPHEPLEQHIVDKEPGKFKRDLLVGESEENKQLRKEFFALLNEYLTEVRTGK
jgi:hypothetical protein